MSVNDLLEQAKQLSPDERRELAQRLLDIDDTPPIGENQPKTGAEIVATLEAMEDPIELVDPHIEDPVEWVKAQRRKRQEHLKQYWGDES